MIEKSHNRNSSKRKGRKIRAELRVNVYYYYMGELDLFLFRASSAIDHPSITSKLEDPAPWHSNSLDFKEKKNPSTHELFEYHLPNH